MKRLAMYAHYGPQPHVAGYVLHYLRQLRLLDFQITFISNSAISRESEDELKKYAARIITRENTGYDFAMWQRGLAESDLAEFDELLLTNSSIIGPLHPLADLWRNPAVADCDFWGLTDNDEMEVHLQSYFLVFQPRVFRSARFAGFWRSVLPYQDKSQVIRSYEIGLTKWLAEGGFKWKAAFPREQIRNLSRERRSLFTAVQRRIRGGTPWQSNTTVAQPDILFQAGMPFLKLALLKESGLEFTPQMALNLLQKANLSGEVLEDLRVSFAVRQ